MAGIILARIYLAPIASNFACAILKHRVQGLFKKFSSSTDKGTFSFYSCSTLAELLYRHERTSRISTTHKFVNNNTFIALEAWLVDSLDCVR